MAQWYKNNCKLFHEERHTLAIACPLLRLAVVGPGFKLNSACSLNQECAIVHGTYGLTVPNRSQMIEYRISILIPEKYPKQYPELFCNDNKLPIDNLDRHIMKNGRACLGIEADINIRWAKGPTIVNFINNFVAPFLTWQAYYDVHQKPPPWGERSHFSKGILEFYAELLDMPVDVTAVGFMRLLARKNCPKGHEPCPCNSGKRLRNCHRELLFEARQRVAWQDVAYDLAVLKQNDKIMDAKNLSVNY